MPDLFLFTPKGVLHRLTKDAASVLREDGESLLLTQDGGGQVVILGSSTGGAEAVEGLLTELRFEPLRPAAAGVFSMREAVMRQVGGQVGQVQQLAQVQARWVPKVFVLHPNYPNPFNPSTTIRYQLPADSQVRLDIYDVLGQNVRTLMSQVQPAGYHQVVWDSRSDAGEWVAAGVYLYRLQAYSSAGEFTQVRKLLLLK